MLPLSRRINNFNPELIDPSSIYSFYVDSSLVGFIRQSFAKVLKDTNNSPFVVEGNRVSIHPKYDSNPDSRTAAIEEFLINLREKEVEPALKGKNSFYLQSRLEK
jgi:hypothetical protein